jgi:hypothetical protein
MGYQRRLPTPPNADEVAAIAYVRSRASELGLTIHKTDSQLRKMLYIFVGRQLKHDVYYQNLEEAAVGYWNQDKPLFELLSLIFRLAYEKMNLGDNAFFTMTMEVSETGVIGSPDYHWKVVWLQEWRLVEQPMQVIFSITDRIFTGNDPAVLEQHLWRSCGLELQ